MEDLVFTDISNESEKLKLRYNFQDENQSEITKHQKFFIDRIDDTINQFYTWLKKQEDYFDQFFSDESLHKTVFRYQHEYWVDFFSKEIDSEYIEARRSIGVSHARINLPLDIYFAGMNIFIQLWNESLKDLPSPADPLKVSGAITKKMLIDCSIVAATYNEKTNLKIANQNQALLEMSTPVTVIWERVLLLPIVGILDSKRTLDMMDSILQKISTSQAVVTLIDISGVAVVDTAVANHLIKVTHATKLMGCETIISGVSPMIAHTIVDLGINVEDIRTTATLKDALSMALEKVSLNEAMINQ